MRSRGSHLESELAEGIVISACLSHYWHASETLPERVQCRALKNHRRLCKVSASQSDFFTALPIDGHLYFTSMLQEGVNSSGESALTRVK